MEGWDYVVVAAYFVLIFGISIYYFFRQKTTSEAYFLAERHAKWWEIGCTYFASNIGSETIVGLAGAGATLGVRASVFDWGSPAMFLILGYVFTPFFFKSRVFSTPEFLERRFSRRCRIYLAVLSLVAYVLTRVAVTVLSAGIVMEETFGISFWVSASLLLLVCTVYIALGGMHALILTEVIQTIVIVVFSAVLLGVSLNVVGGMEGLRASLPDRFFHIVSNEEPYPWTGLLLGYPILAFWFHVTDQEMVQRGLAGKSVAHVQAGCVMAGFLKLVPPFAFLIPGMVARVRYGNELGCTGLGVDDECSKADSAFAVMVVNHLPEGLRGLMAAAMLAAVMSSIASAFNSTATIAAMDLYRNFAATNPSEARLVFVGRLAIITVTVLACLWIPLVYSVASTLYVALQTTNACLAPPISAVFILGIFVPRVNEQGAFWSLVIGHTVGMLRLVLVIAGSDDPLANFNFLHYMAAMFVLSICLAMGISYLTEPPKGVSWLTWSGRGQMPPEQTTEREGNGEEEKEPLVDRKDHPVEAGEPDPTVILVLAVGLAICSAYLIIDNA